jgi:hypothetical protein
MRRRFAISDSNQGRGCTGSHLNGFQGVLTGSGFSWQPAQQSDLKEEPMALAKQRSRCSSLRRSGQDPHWRPCSLRMALLRGFCHGRSMGAGDRAGVGALLLRRKPCTSVGRAVAVFAQAAAASVGVPFDHPHRGRPKKKSRMAKLPGTRQRGGGSDTCTSDPEPITSGVPFRWRLVPGRRQTPGPGTSCGSRKRRNGLLRRAKDFDEASCGTWSKAFTRWMLTLCPPRKESSRGANVRLDLRRTAAGSDARHDALQPATVRLPAEECAGLRVRGRRSPLTDLEDGSIRKDGTILRLRL